MFKKLFGMVLLVLCGLCCLSVLAQQQTSSAVSQLAQQLASYHSYSANFKQTTFNRYGRVLQRSQGKVMIQRPGRFRWETSKPLHQLIIANGNTLWVYDVDLAQASRQTIQQQGLSPGVLLSGSVDDLAKQFIINYRSDHWFELKPKQANNNFQLVRMQFQHGQLTALQMVNPLGQNTVFYFKKIKLNQQLADKWFNFTPPAGVDVLS